jgi:hypothetical protein
MGKTAIPGFSEAEMLEFLDGLPPAISEIDVRKALEGAAPKRGDYRRKVDPAVIAARINREAKLVLGAVVPRPGPAAILRKATRIEGAAIALRTLLFSDPGGTAGHAAVGRVISDAARGDLPRDRRVSAIRQKYMHDQYADQLSSCLDRLISAAREIRGNGGIEVRSEHVNLVPKRDSEARERFVRHVARIFSDETGLSGRNHRKDSPVVRFVHHMLKTVGRPAHKSTIAGQLKGGGRIREDTSGVPPH